MHKIILLGFLVFLVSFYSVSQFDDLTYRLKKLKKKKIPSSLGLKYINVLSVHMT